MKDAFPVYCEFEKIDIMETRAWTCINATVEKFCDWNEEVASGGGTCFLCTM